MASISQDTVQAADSIVTSPTPAEPIFQIPCAICRRQFSKYTCAQCNVPYCSLICYRSEKHADCSETFYRREVKNDIHTAPSKSKEEREQMMELLKKFEEEDRNQSEAQEDKDEDEDEDDLVERLQGVDLDLASSDEMWELLTHVQRQRFTQALHQPNSELAQQLLLSETVGEDLTEPWWTSDSNPLDNTPFGLRPSSFESSTKHGPKPSGPIVPLVLRQQASLETALRLVYNGAYISIAYAYVTRRLSTSPLSSGNDSSHTAETRRMVANLVPFLVDRHSQVLHHTLSSAITDVFARFEADSRTSALLAFLLQDASQVLKPSVISAVQDDDDALSGPCENLLLCLSDLHSLFSRDVPEAAITKREIAAARKLLFYAAHLALVPAAIWQGLSYQLSTRAEQERTRG